MLDWIILLILFLSLLYALGKYFKPRIDIVVTGLHTYDVYLWYSDYSEYEEKRKYKRIYSKRK